MTATWTEREILIDAGTGGLPGSLLLPADCRGVVIFAHGSGSSRRSPRNQAVAAEFARRGCGALLFDLLTPAEARHRHNVFDIDLLARRVAQATGQLGADSATRGMPLGYFGASTGAAAALVAAAGQGGGVAAVVSRGGRPDLAGEALPAVSAPTLLIVGSRDRDVLELNRTARRRLRCPSALELVQGAGHLFEEPGALERVADLAAAWFLEHLPPRA